MLLHSKNSETRDELDTFYKKIYGAMEPETDDGSVSDILKHRVLTWKSIRAYDHFYEALKSRPDELDAEQAEAANRVAAQIQRNIDYIMLGFGGRWKTINQVASVGISIVLILLSLYLYYPTAIDTWQEQSIWLVTALFGGMVAPVARDILAGLQSLRGRAR